ncbi:MAG TPA: PIN domain-containing protein [Thermoanaerobaculia bacterium]|nr:PIN domain-containing protein [Thermoanaerobaculia bacterium]
MESKQGRPVTALDASVIVAGLLSSHEHHEPAAAALTALLTEPGDVILPLQALVEAYSVMTRLPSPHRLSAKDALAVLDRSLRQRTVVVELDGEEAWQLIEGLSQRQIAGATSYDGVIAACARKGGAQRILTFNRSHFERLAGAGLEVVVP